MMVEDNPARTRTLSRFRELCDYLPTTRPEEVGAAGRRRAPLLARRGNPDSPGKSVNIANGSQVGTTLNGLIGGLPNGLDARVTLLKGLLPISLQLKPLTDPLIAGLKPAIVDPLTSLVTNTVDPLLDNVLAALGIQLGDATVWATGARCAVPVLI